MRWRCRAETQVSGVRRTKPHSQRLPPFASLRKHLTGPDDVITRKWGARIGSGLAEERRGPRRAAKNPNVVVAGAAIQRAEANEAIGAVTGAENLAEAGGIDEQIVAGSGVENVIAGDADQNIVAKGLSPHLIVSIPGSDDVIAPFAANRVVSRPGVDDVVAGGANDHVVAACAANRSRFRHDDRWSQQIAGDRLLRTDGRWSPRKRHEGEDE